MEFTSDILKNSPSFEATTQLAKLKGTSKGLVGMI